MTQRQYEYQKMQNLVLISHPLKKVQKTHAKKINNKKATEKWSFLLLLQNCVQKVLAYTFFGVNFFTLFFNTFELGIEFCILWYQYRIFAKKFFLHILLKPDATETAQKYENLIL
jgi:hypothetical protein